MSSKGSHADAPAEPSPVSRHVSEWVCTDCDYDEHRATTGVVGALDRCPACGGHLVMPRDAMGE